MKSTITSYDEQMRQIFREYAKEHGETDLVDLTDVFEWAKQNKLWDKAQPTLLRLFKREMQHALRSEKIAGDEGPVRRNHAIRIKQGDKQLHLWIPDILRAKPSHARLSFQQRRLVIAQAAIQHSRDTRYYNKKNVAGAQLEFSYNFDQHVQDARHPTEYPDERPQED